MASLIGTWHGVYAEADGEIAPAGYPASLEATYEEHRFSIKVHGKVEHEGTYSVDDKVEPHQITFVYTKSSRFEVDKKRTGIYQLIGETYKNCMGAVGAKPPSGFNTTSKSDTALTILTKGPAPDAKVAEVTARPPHKIFGPLW